MHLLQRIKKEFLPYHLLQRIKKEFLPCMCCKELKKGSFHAFSYYDN